MLLEVWGWVDRRTGRRIRQEMARGQQITLGYSEARRPAASTKIQYRCDNSPALLMVGRSVEILEASKHEQARQTAKSAKKRA